jgi:hypothetical protein
LTTAAPETVLGPYPAKRGALTSTAAHPALVRDDRDRVAVLHALAWRWYGAEHPRTTGAWALNACGFLPSFLAIRGDGSNPQERAESITYPTLGQVVLTLSLNGQVIDANSPITSVVYDVDRDQTTWTMDWQDLDYV